MIDFIRSWLSYPAPERVGNPAPTTNPPHPFCTHCGGRIKIHGEVTYRRFDKDTGKKVEEQIDWLWRCETLSVLSVTGNAAVRSLDYQHDWYEAD